MYLHKYIFVHIIYRQVFIKSGTYKSKYDGLPEGFQLVRITEQRACSENVSTENFRGKFKSISIVDEAYFYKLFLEQQLVADVIFYVWYCCGNKMSPGVWKEKQQTVGNRGETKLGKHRKRKRQIMRCWKKMTSGIQEERKGREKRTGWISCICCFFCLLVIWSIDLILLYSNALRLLSEEELQGVGRHGEYLLI